MTAKTKLICLKNPPKRIDNPLYIGRGSKWGNPYVIGKHGDRASCVSKYRSRLWRDKELLGQLGEIDGKTLMCFCAADQECHGEVLLAALVWWKKQPKEDAASAMTPQRQVEAAAKGWSRRVHFADDVEIPDAATKQALALHDVF